MKIDFGQLIHALADTIDLVGIDEIQHGKRVGFMALECARTMGADRNTQLLLYRAGLLHDCGVSSSRVHKNLVNQLDWTESYLHCKTGAERLRQFRPLALFSDIILYHHSRWQDLKKLKVSDDIKKNANLIYLLDRVNALVAMENNPNRLACRNTIFHKIVSLKGEYFKPELVDIFLETAQREAFWITQEPIPLMHCLHDQLREADEILLDNQDLKKMATIFAQIVDAKSPYTAEHSVGVSRLAGYIAGKCNLSDQDVGKIEVAGLLHDLGKLQIPDTVLEHEGALDEGNLAIMRHHSYVTNMILSRINGLEEITRWAADHHEKLDGSGYPFKRKENELGIESRIIMVADIFQALAQHRPYRKPQSAEMITGYLGQLAEDGKIDKNMVQLVQHQPTQCLRAALGR
jgi:putative nucleotidyltransferase with HDIG domain